MIFEPEFETMARPALEALASRLLSRPELGSREEELVLELLEARGVDVLAEANRETAGLGLAATAFTGLEDSFIFDPVTEADREAERVMRAILAVRRPGDAILGLIERYSGRQFGIVNQQVDPPLVQVDPDPVAGPK